MAATKATAAIIARGTSNAAFTQLTGASATVSGTTMSVTKTSHGLSNGNLVLIQGFNDDRLNGVFTVANSAANTFDVTVKTGASTPAGTPATLDKVTLGTVLDLSAAYGGNVVGGIQNTTTGPTIAPQLWMGVAGANNEYDYIWSQVSGGDTTANSWSPFKMSLSLGMSFINFAVCRNTGQAVDCALQATYVTAV